MNNMVHDECIKQALISQFVSAGGVESKQQKRAVQLMQDQLSLPSFSLFSFSYFPLLEFLFDHASTGAKTSPGEKAGESKPCRRRNQQRKELN
jgi:hypothetical protein